MTDYEINREQQSHRVGWFAAGALCVALVVGLFLYADGYFNKANSAVEADTPALIIEAK
jgi:hypothetical protein